MKIEFLGSGGATTIPRPGCTCHVCVEARERGAPYSRMGPCVFVHGPDVLIDTPEEAWLQLDRSTIRTVPACFYSHWHPDHVAGRRVWEKLNADWLNWPPNHRRTDIYLPQQVAADFRRMAIREQFEYLERFGVARVIELADGDTVTLNGWTIRPFRLAQDYVYAFLFEGEGRRVLIAPDELFCWEPPEYACHPDLAVVPMGIPEFDMFTGERAIPADHPVLKLEATFEQTLAIVRRLDAKRTVMTHIEEPFGLGYDDLLRLEEKLQREGYPITFAHDMLIVDV